MKYNLEINMQQLEGVSIAKLIWSSAEANLLFKWLLSKKRFDIHRISIIKLPTNFLAVLK